MCVLFPVPYERGVVWCASEVSLFRASRAVCRGSVVGEGARGNVFCAVCVGTFAVGECLRTRTPVLAEGMHHYFPAPTGPPPPISQFLSPDSPFPDYF